MPDFAVKLGGSRQANADVLNFLPQSPWAVEWEFWYHQIVSFNSSQLTLPAATTYTIALSTLFPNNSFPADVDILPGTKCQLIDAFAGGAISDFDIELGDAADDNELMTAFDVFGTAASYFTTPAAANYDRHYESAFAPLMTWTATGANVDQLTAGSIEVWIPWTPLKEIG